MSFMLTCENKRKLHNWNIENSLRNAVFQFADISLYAEDLLF